MRSHGLHLNLDRPRILDLLEPAIHQLLIDTDEGRIFRQNLMLDRLFDGLLLLIDDLHIVHVLLNGLILLGCCLEALDDFAVGHLVDEGHVVGFGVDGEGCLEGEVVEGVLVGEVEGGGGGGVGWFEGYVEVNDLVLEDVWEGGGVGDDALDQCGVVV